MSASRTLLNKQGRKPGPLAYARSKFPVPRALRMAAPRGPMQRVSNVDRIKSACVYAALAGH